MLGIPGNAPGVTSSMSIGDGISAAARLFLAVSFLPT